jgi:hypothetical protein
MAQVAEARACVWGGRRSNIPWNKWGQHMGHKRSARLWLWLSCLNTRMRASSGSDDTSCRSVSALHSLDWEQCPCVSEDAAASGGRAP